MTKMQAEQAFSDLDRYEDLIRDFGYSNDSAIQEVKSIVTRLRSIGSMDSYFLEKIAQMDEYASIGFSARRWSRYTNGASDVRVYALSAANTVRDLIFERSAR